MFVYMNVQSLYGNTEPALMSIVIGNNKYSFIALLIPIKSYQVMGFI